MSRALALDRGPVSIGPGLIRMTSIPGPTRAITCGALNGRPRQGRRRRIPSLVSRHYRRCSWLACRIGSFSRSHRFSDYASSWQKHRWVRMKSPVQAAGMIFGPVSIAARSAELPFCARRLLLRHLAAIKLDTSTRCSTFSTAAEPCLCAWRKGVVRLSPRKSQ